MEARVGIEPTNAAFAEPCLTTWLPRHRDSEVNLFHARIKFSFAPEISLTDKSKFATPFPKLLRLENSQRCDDSGDQFRRSHVKTQIARAARWIRHTDKSALTTRIDSPC